MLIRFYLTGVVHISSKRAAEFVASLTVISKTRFDSWSHFLFFLPLLTDLFFFFLLHGPFIKCRVRNTIRIYSSLQYLNTKSLEQ